MGPRTLTGGGAGGGGTTRSLTLRGSGDAIIQPLTLQGERRRNNSTAVVGLLLVAGRTALPSLPSGSSGAFFVVPPAVTVLQVNTTEDNKDDCARAEDARDERGRGEDAHRDRGCQQEEAPAEERQPDRGCCGGAAAR